ncbi:hypothetical protein CapIbe_014994 [Capra ibex]
MCPTLLSFLSLGKYEKLSLSAWPSPMVPLGQNVTLRCHSHSPLKRFRLFKTDGKRRLPKLQGHYFNNFTLGPVTKEHAGSYMCSVANWSALSDPLQIVVTGVSTKPTISAHPGPLVQVGENVTLRCHSLVWFDKFILHQENSTGLFQRCGQMLTGGYAAADFFIGPMTLASVGTYRCYGSLRRSPYEWSAPSDPVDIIITGRSRKPSLSAQGGPVSLLVVRLQQPTVPVCHRIHYKYLPVNHGSTHHRRSTASSRPLQPCWHLVLGLSIAFISISIFIAVLVCHWLPIKCCHHGRRAQGRQNSEWRAEDVIFVHLNHRTLSERLFTPTPLSPMHLFTETSIYEELDVNQDHADPDLAPSFAHTECYKLKSSISF